MVCLQQDVPDPDADEDMKSPFEIARDPQPPSPCLGDPLEAIKEKESLPLPDSNNSNMTESVKDPSPEPHVHFG